jgi:Zn-dependent protease
MQFDTSSILIIIASLAVAITIHEMMHAFTARWLGDTTASDMGRVTLNPLAHIDPVLTILLPAVLILFGLPPILAAKPVPFNPDQVKFEEFGSALIGIAGPFTNLALAFLTAGALNIFQPDFGTLTREALLIFMQLNVGLFVFNMLPIPPLDGSRLVYAFAPEPLQRVMLQIEQFGIAGILLILFILLPFISPIISELNSFILALLV